MLPQPRTTSRFNLLFLIACQGVPMYYMHAATRAHFRDTDGQLSARAMTKQLATFPT